jgi:hypothetical protein
MNRDLIDPDAVTSHASHGPLRRASTALAHLFDVYLAMVLIPHKHHYDGMDGK